MIYQSMKLLAMVREDMPYARRDLHDSNIKVLDWQKVLKHI